MEVKSNGWLFIPLFSSFAVARCCIRTVWMERRQKKKLAQQAAVFFLPPLQAAFLPLDGVSPPLHTPVINRDGWVGGEAVLLQNISTGSFKKDLVDTLCVEDCCHLTSPLRHLSYPHFSPSFYSPHCDSQKSQNPVRTADALFCVLFFPLRASPN